MEFFLGGTDEGVRPYESFIYLEHAGWPQSQAISASSEPASLQNWLQYFSPAGAMQTQGTWAHFDCLSVGMEFPF